MTNIRVPVCLADGCGRRCVSMVRIRNLRMVPHARFIMHPTSTDHIIYCDTHFSDYLHKRGWS